MAQTPDVELEYQRLAEARRFIYEHNQPRSIEECRHNAKMMRGQAYLFRQRFQGYVAQQAPYQDKLHRANSFLKWVVRLFQTFGLVLGLGLMLNTLFTLDRPLGELCVLAGLVVLCRAVAELIGYVVSEHLLRRCFNAPWRRWRDQLSDIHNALLPVKIAHDELEDQAALLDNRATEMANRRQTSHQVIRPCVPTSELSLPF